MKRNIIGEGSYGCVHSPSIHCKTPPKPNFDYKNYVSKIMKTTNAEQELAEFLIIGNIDPTNEYHLGEPILCKPNLDETNTKNDIKKCKHIKYDDLIADPDKYSLLVLTFGGPDLKSFCKNELVKYLKKDKQKRIDNFWLEVHQLIKGLKAFKDNHIVHNDIKPHNILFNTTTGKMKYIDFGLMRTKQQIIASSKNSDNFLSIYHWSYPLDCGFMDKKQYNMYKHRNPTRRNVWKELLAELIIVDAKTPNTLNLPINNPEAFDIIFTYLNPTNTTPNASTQYGYIDSFFNGFNEKINNENYNQVLNFIVDSIDVFGLGFTLQFVANHFKNLNALSLEHFTRLSSFFHTMYDFNPLSRIININQLLNEYENVLLEMGVLTRLKKSFTNNILVNAPPAPPIIMNESKSTSTEHLSVALQKMADKNPVELTNNKCPEHKIINPKTNRCVKKCVSGYIRNNSFRCVKQTMKQRLNKTGSKNKNKSSKSIK